MADRVSVNKGKDKTAARDRGMAMYTRNVRIVNDAVVSSGFTDLVGVSEATMYMQ